MRKAKPVHVLSQIKFISRSPKDISIAIIDYWHNKRRTEVPFADILRIESECEELIVTIKSSRIRTYYRRNRATAKLRVCHIAA
jgi:hypothetical protein